MKIKYISVFAVLIFAFTTIFFLNYFSENKEFKDSKKLLTEIIGRSKEIESLTYNYKSDSPKGKKEGIFWHKRKMVKAEIKEENMVSIILSNKEEKTLTIYSPHHELAIKRKFSEAPEDLEVLTWGSPLMFLDYNLVILGEEIVDDKECIIVAYSQEGVNVKVWIWEEYGIPIKIKVPVEGGLNIIQITNIEFIDIADDFFKLPEGVQIRSIM